MDKENPPPAGQLNADYYRRKNWTNVVGEGGGPTVSRPAVGVDGIEATTAMASQQQHPPTLPPPPPSPAPRDPRSSRAARVVASVADGGGGGRVQRGGAVAGRARLLASRAGRLAIGSLRVGGAAVGFAVACGVAHHAYQSHVVDDFFGATAATASDDRGGGGDGGGGTDGDGRRRRRRVLILPLGDLRVVERRRGGSLPSLDDIRSRLADPDAPNGTITVEAREVVRALHAAASDPNVVAAYADFGEGMTKPMGNAHAGEIRDAMRVFNESHRVHRDPNVHPSSRGARSMPSSSSSSGVRHRERKRSHAFGHSYSWREYHLASGCSYVHLQARGHLHLFGSSAGNVFLGGAMDRYGIKAHVFRHGEYKNAPSILTDTKYSKAHLETVRSITSSIDDTMRICIENSRHPRLANFDSVMWRSIFDYGSLTSSNSAEIGLVDATPPADPLSSLLDVNESARKGRIAAAAAGDAAANNGRGGGGGGGKRDAPPPPPGGDDARRAFEGRFGAHDGYRKFDATESVTLSRYLDMLNKRDEVERRRGRIDDVLRGLSGSSTATSMILSALGMRPDDDASSSSSSRWPSKRCDRIAVVTVDGSIDRSCASRVIRSLREIKKDKQVKAVVLRVDSPGGSVVSSEAILEEIKLLDKPVVCSMSNAAASGGYYISMNSERIFANPMTLTGSIGVFGIKFDASEFAKSYGVTGDYHPRGSHAAAENPLTPLTPGMKENIARTVRDYYDYFKAIVATGRAMSVDDVEEVARGRVWTGEQAREVGLVDSLGGLDRAVSYARRAYATTDRVEVDHYPRISSMWDVLLSSRGLSSYTDILRASFAVMLGFGDGDGKRGSVEKLLGGLSELKFAKKPHFMVTMDEETAIDVIMKGDRL